VLPASVACAAERGFIGGVLRLAEWGVQLPPLQYRQARLIWHPSIPPHGIHAAL
jgi:hypothetical protein